MYETQTIVHHFSPVNDETRNRAELMKEIYRKQGYSVTQKESCICINITARKTLRKENEQ